MKLLQLQSHHNSTISSDTGTARVSPSGSATDSGAGSVHVTVLSDRCAGCQECVVRCPTGALSMELKSWTAVAQDSLCVGCRQCVRTCPFSAITVDGPVLVAPRVEVSHHVVKELQGNVEETRSGFLNWSDVLAEAQRCLRCPDPTCVRGCPVHNDIPSFIAAVRDGDLDEAHSVLRRTSFLPDVCSRVCDQAVQCEGACTWSLAGGTPVAIGAIERFITDNAAVPPIVQENARGAGISVAVVGSGPAGIGAAFELVRSGAQVTVYEKETELGGLLHNGIPGFTLPRQISHRPWQQLKDAGVRCVEGTTVTSEFVESLRAHYDAVLLAHGAGAALRLPVTGGDLKGVVDATTFLNEALAALTQSKRFPLFDGLEDGRREDGPTVLVLGAGNTAMDVARLARRLGAKAICLDWMDERFAPVRPDELSEARDEGVDIRFRRTLIRLEGDDGRVRFAHIAPTTQARADKLPKVTQGSEAIEAVDLVVMAMGYRIDSSFTGLAPTKPMDRTVPDLVDRQFQASGLLAGGAPAFARHRPVGRLSLAREIGRLGAALGTEDGIYVAGDALIGPSSVVEAMAQGRRAAEAIMSRRAHAVSLAGEVKVATVLIAYDSAGGHTKTLALELAEDLEHHGAVVTAKRLCDIGLREIVAADLFVVGTWVQGYVVAGVGPARSTRGTVAALPNLGATKIATFCSYGVHPRATLRKLRNQLQEHGAHVVAEQAFSSQLNDRSAVAAFSSQLFDMVKPVPRTDDVIALLAKSSQLSSLQNAVEELAHFVNGHEMLLEQSRTRLIEQLALHPDDEGLRRALETIEQTLRALAPSVEV